MMTTLLSFSLPLLSVALAFMYWRRASIGLEDHLKLVSIGFGVLSLYELLGLSFLFRDTHLPWLFRLVQPFGALNLLYYAVLVTASLILAKWTWYYLLKRLSTQLFMLALSGAVGLSLLITGLFVTLLLKSVEAESLHKLTSNAHVVSSLLTEKQARLRSETALFGQDSVVSSAVARLDRQVLLEKVQTQMRSAHISSLIVLDSAGKVILKGENTEERGVSLSEDPYVTRALSGEVASGVVSRDGVVAPEVSLRVAVPIAGGVIMTSQLLDTAYVDGLKETTGLSVSVYGNQVLSATTHDIGDGKTRLSGIAETNSVVLEHVWKQGELYATATTLGESDYLSAYIPLRDLSGTIVGVMQISEPQVASLQAAGSAVQLTFALVIAVMLLLSLPIYWICQRLVAQWE
jgi:hypothetical protein